jgi:CBS domain-containing protein
MSTEVEITTEVSEERPETALQEDTQEVPSGFTQCPPQLIHAAELLKNGEVPERVTVRTLLDWYRVQRRGSFIVWYIRKELEKLGITTDPDFNSVWIGSEVAFVLAPNEVQPPDQEKPNSSASGLSEQIEVTAQPAVVAFVGGDIEDPTYRIGKLDAANKTVVSVAPTQSIEYATTQMLSSGYSQLPVMQGDRDVKGMLTWESIGARFAIGKTGKEVRDFMTTAQLISSDMSLFAAIEIITKHQYVLVQSSDKRISGIVTSADLSEQFQQLTEPFLLLSEIEQHIRKLIADKFTAEELKGVCDPNDPDRKIDDVADLTMGEYIRLLENPTNWERLLLRIDRASFIERLQTVRRIRNDIMHFDPDPLGSDDLASLRQFVLFSQTLRELGAF